MLTIDYFRQDAWAHQNPRLLNDWPALTPHRHRDHALRTDYVHKVADGTHPNDPIERQMVYGAPFDYCRVQANGL